MAIQNVPFTSKSGNILSINYDDEAQSLIVVFRGGTYAYKQVPTSEIEGISKADSAGSYLHTNIKGQYDYERVED